MTAQAATTFTVIHRFQSTPTDGLAAPNGFLAQGRDGNLYGTSSGGGASGGAFKVSPNLPAPGNYTRLVNFNPLLEGARSKSGFSLGNDGNFYGTTNGGGANGAGTIFKMTPTGIVSVLHDFKLTSPTCNANDAAGSPDLPTSVPVQERDGNWYGTTPLPLGGNCNPGGTVYQLTATNSFSVIRHMNGITDGGQSLAPLILGKDGNFYGTTGQGGSLGGGTVFRVTPTGALKPLHNFKNIDTEGRPTAPLVQGIDGNFYGTTKSQFNSKGSIFKMTPAGAVTPLHTFDFVNAFADGSGPKAGLVQASDGNFYGTTLFGGLNNLSSTGCGVLFKVTPTGIYSVLHKFDFITDGCPPSQNMTLHTNGKIYGATLNWGSPSGTIGTIFELDIGARPFVRPQVSVAKVGEKFALYGDFSGTVTKLTLGGVSAPFIRDPDPNNGNTTLIVTVPAGAKTGAIAVFKGAASTTGLKPFNILPTFTSFSPTSGAVGNAVILKGTGLTETTKVTFSANKTAPFTVDNDSQLTVNVPIGAVTGKITITTKGGSVSSVAKFTVTP